MQASAGGQAGQGRGQFDPAKLEAARKKIRAIEADALEEMEKGFSSEQKSSWKELVGAPFDTTTLRPMAGRGNRGGDTPRQNRDN
jgi:hypothetical protein